MTTQTDGRSHDGQVLDGRELDGHLMDDSRITAAVDAILDRRVVIEQAKGMLMAIYGIDADRAFDVLRRFSQERNVKLLHVAQQVIEDFREAASGRRTPSRQEYDNLLQTLRIRLEKC